MLCPTAGARPSDITAVGPTSRPVKRLTVVISDGWLRPSEISYVRRLKTVGDNPKSSNISYVRRFRAYVRQLWPSEIVSFTVVIQRYRTDKD
jgi:hypothetical protein